MNLENTNYAINAHTAIGNLPASATVTSHDKANAGIRREFFLPVDRPFNVKTAQGTPPPILT